MRFAVHALLVAACLAAAPAVAQAPDDTATAPPARAPATGIAVLDCEPEIPAPEHACLVRVPPTGRLIEDGEDGTEVLAVSGEAALAPVFVGAGDAAFPDGLNAASTLILVDLTPGPRAGRRAAFDREIALTKRLLAQLPGDERIGIYGFDEGYRQIAPFQSDRAAIEAALDGIELTGNNTLLRGGLEKAIATLSADAPSIVKRLIVVSDGDDEAGLSAGEVTALRDAADDAGIQIVSLGFFWRAVGSAENAPGRQLMESLARGPFGVFVGADLVGESAAATDRLTEDAEAEIDALGAALARSAAESRFIALTENPRSADVAAVIETPRLGSPDAMERRRYEARLTVASAPPAEEEPPVVAEDEPTGVGFPVIAALVAVGLLSLAAVAFLLLRRSDPSPGMAAAPAGGGSPDIDFGGGADTNAGPDRGGDTAIAEIGRTAAVIPAQVAFLLRQGGGERFTINAPRTTIGRAPGNDIVLPEAEVSANHAVITVSRAGIMTLSDTGSTNGTFRNGKKITTAELEPGDALTFGTSAFVIKEA